MNEPSLYERQARADAKRYERERALPGLIPLWPAELVDYSLEGRRLIVAKLEEACLTERRRHWHWSYSVNRHQALLAAYYAERDQLTEAMREENRIATDNVLLLVRQMQDLLDGEAA